LALRLLFLENHYRTQINLTWASIEAAHTTLKRWRKKIASWPKEGVVDPEIHREIISHFSDDLDTAGAILLIRKIERDESVPEAKKRAILLAADALLGLELDRQDELMITDEVQELLVQRESARRERNWSRSDQLRDLLLEHGIRVADGPEGQSWEAL
ncbi:MAG: hypothetical protein RIS22_1011, partial [Actinomycetota bacterium]